MKYVNHGLKQVYLKELKIISSFFLKSLGENKPVKSVKLFPASIKSMKQYKSIDTLLNCLFVF